MISLYDLYKKHVGESPCQKNTNDICDEVYDQVVNNIKEGNKLPYHICINEVASRELINLLPPYLATKYIVVSNMQYEKSSQRVKLTVDAIKKPRENQF